MQPTGPPPQHHPRPSLLHEAHPEERGANLGQSPEFCRRPGPLGGVLTAQGHARAHACRLCVLSCVAVAPRAMCRRALRALTGYASGVAAEAGEGAGAGAGSAAAGPGDDGAGPGLVRAAAAAGAGAPAPPGPEQGQCCECCPRPRQSALPCSEAPPPGPGRRAPSSKALQLFFPSGGWTPLRGCPLGPMLLWSTHSSQQHPWVF